MSTPTLPTSNARAPAGKRSGLKHKAASNDQREDASSHSPAAFATASMREGGAASAKRKPSAAPPSGYSAKKRRSEDVSTGTPRTPKSVSFAAEPEVLTLATPTTNGKKGPKKQRQDTPASKKATEPNSKNPARPAKPVTKKLNSTANLQSAVDYLRQWHSARDQWKFNKNHQTRLLEYVFSEENTIPPLDINIFYEYIKPLKGFVRKRLRETAEQLRQKDMEQGAAGFPSSATAGSDAAARKQAEYEQVIAGYMQQEKPATPTKRRFEEVEYVLRTTDREMQQRVVKRMRAETVIEELGDSESDDAARATTTMSAASTSSKAGSEGSSEPGGASLGDGDKRVKLNDGSQRRLRKNRKVRTAEVEDSSSSSESESESETSSSGSDSSSDDSDSDEEMAENPAQNNAETSSSSSSSSESEDSEDDSSDEED
jgi:hypothetical protein